MCIRDRAEYDVGKVKKLLANPGIIRNKMKIIATINNAKAFIKVQNEEGSFVRLEQGTNYYISQDLGFIRVRDQISQDILGCTFVLTDRSTGDTLMVVGQGPDSAGTNLSLMMFVI